MKICKVKPDHATCSACVETQQIFDVVDDCSKCKLNTEIYELLQIGTSFWSGDYAMVQKDGKIQKVSLKRIYDCLLYTSTSRIRSVIREIKIILWPNEELCS